MATQGPPEVQHQQQEGSSVAQTVHTVNAISNFVAGNIANHISSWRSITTDPSILEIVSGYFIEFESIPSQPAVPHITFSKGDDLIIAGEINKLLEKRVIHNTTHSDNEFITTVFTRPKKDGSHRLILNLKQLNGYVTYHHFKMESLQSAVQLLKKDYWMAVLDLKDAYYSVPINPQHRKFLRFQFNGSLYEFTCLPNGLSSAPRVFTKLMKPVYTTLRSKGYLIVGYIDDILLLAKTPHELAQVVAETIALLKSLGFTIHESKCVTTPSQVAKFLGFLLNSQDMIISMIPEKAAIIKSKCLNLAQLKGPIPIRDVASVVGLMVSAFEGVQYAPLFYRSLENDKTYALKSNGWDLEGKMTLSPLATQDLSWWITNVDQLLKAIMPKPADLTLMTDSSLKGWGGVIEGSSCVARGRWSHQESQLHINILELKAILLALQALCNHMQNNHIKILCDNTTAVAYIRTMGGTKSNGCNDITREIFMWCIDRKLTLSISHLPGKLNTEADKASREFNNSNTEWSLDQTAFTELKSKLGEPEVDMFASRLNHKTPRYIAWGPDPGAVAIDAFTIDWSKYNLIYCFPPFSLIGKVLQFIQESKVTAILVYPHWPTQFWYPHLLQLMKSHPVTIKMRKKTLTLPHQPDKIHPLFPKLQLHGCLVSSHH